jgi:signal transduction histidine kinase
MISLRSRLLLFCLVFTGGTLGLGSCAYDAFSALRDRRQQIEISYDIRDAVEDVSGIKPDSDHFKKLQSYRSKLWPQRRMEEFSNLLQAINDSNPRLVKQRHEVVLKNEVEFERFTRQEMTYMEKRLVYFGSLLILVMSVGFVSIQMFMQRSVIRPLEDLSRKMVDFLNDRYTYQFSVPSPDEIGHMQSTFNSLAQRVISNMEQLRTLDQAKSDFLSIASHELRTPLTSIKGSLSLMRSGVVGKMNEMAENLLCIAETETDRLIRLINDILDLAKIEARKLSLACDWVNMNDLVKICLDSLQGLAQQTEVKLETDAMPPLEVHIDRDRIQQVLTNLLSNAIKFSPKGSTVTVRCTETEEQILVVEVSDQGRGISPEDQELLFQKFRQVTSAKNPLVKGTGLGLAIAKALVEEHGGTIGVRSVPGDGSTFYFTLTEWRYKMNKAPEVAA